MKLAKSTTTAMALVLGLLLLWWWWTSPSMYREGMPALAVAAMNQQNEQNAEARLEWGTKTDLSSRNRKNIKKWCSRMSLADVYYKYPFLQKYTEDTVNAICQQAGTSGGGSSGGGGCSGDQQCPDSGLRGSGFGCKHPSRADRCCKTYKGGPYPQCKTIKGGEAAPAAAAPAAPAERITAYSMSDGKGKISEDFNEPKLYNMRDYGGWNDNIASIRVPPNRWLSVWMGPDASGKHMVLGPGLHNLRNFSDRSADIGSEYKPDIQCSSPSDTARGSGDNGCWRNSISSLKPHN